MNTDYKSKSSKAIKNIDDLPDIIIYNDKIIEQIKPDSPDYVLIVELYTYKKTMQFAWFS